MERLGMPLLDGLDHPVIRVRDLDAATAAYRRLGFTLAPRGSHFEWGTGNCCAMFPSDYLELRGVVENTRYLHRPDTFLSDQGEGLLGCAFRPALPLDALVSELQQRALEPAGPRELTRNFELPSGTIPVRFRLVFFKPDAVPGLMSSLVCQHLTPSVLRHPEWLKHENGALAVESVASIVDDLEEVVAAASSMFGAEAVERRSHVIAVAMGGGSWYYAIDRGRAVDCPLLPTGGAPRLVAVSIKVSAPGLCAELLCRNGVAYSVERGPSVVVGAKETCGVVMAFTSGQPPWAT
jgi:catechol 2,3-dioxygenase-like lactoylglutathione lyase family enzyme